MNMFAKIRSKSKVSVSLWSLESRLSALKDSIKAQASYFFSTDNTLIIELLFFKDFVFC